MNLLEKIRLLYWFIQGCHKRRFLIFPMNAIHDLVPLKAFSYPKVNCYLKELPSLLRGLDEKSARVFLSYLSFACVCSTIKGQLVADAANPDFPMEKFFSEKSRIAKKTGLSEDQILPEVFCSKLGLQFLPDKVLEYMKNKLFLDCGAFIGDSALVMLDFSPDKIWAFDISHQNAERFQQIMNINHIAEDKIKFFSYGLGEKECRLSFSDNHAGGTSLLAEGKDIAEIVPLDKCCKKSQTVGFIKADLEGYGVKMLKGAIETIKRDRPVLSLAIYHNPEEFFETKPLLESLNLNYKFKIIPTAPTLDGEIYLLAYPAELT